MRNTQGHNTETGGSKILGKGGRQSAPILTGVRERGTRENFENMDCEIRLF